MAKRRSRPLPLFALIVALGAICGLSLLWYDRYSHSRTLREIHSIAGFASPLRLIGKVIDA